MPNPSFPAITHLSPVLVVERVEPCVAFWVDRFGFAAENQVPGADGHLVFASVAKDGVEIMYQTRASVQADWHDGQGAMPSGPTVLFLAVPDLDHVERAVAGAPVVKARHRTPYGSTEIYVREPGGHMVGFARF